MNTKDKDKVITYARAENELLREDIQIMKDLFRIAKRKFIIQIFILWGLCIFLYLILIFSL